MSKEVILKIKEAEAEAARIRAEAAQAESDALLAAGEPYLADAVRMIIGGIFEKCQ